MAADLEDTRRLFLRVAAASVSGAAIAACGGSAEAAPPTAAPSPPAAAPTPAPTPTPAPAPPPLAPPPAPSPAAPPAGNVINATPSDYLGKLSQLKAGDTLLLAPGNYGVDASGNDTSSVPGLPIFNLNGTAAAPITITGPASGPMPVLLGRSTHNTVRLANASHIVIRRLEIDGRDRGGVGVATQGPTHHITVEDCHLHGFRSDQQIVAISTVGNPTWNWVVRCNLIAGAGTGMYFGNSNGDSPFVAGLIEHNVVRDCIGYCMQIKHQVVWASVPAGMPTGRTTTMIRHNVFAKSGNSSTGANARPNLLVGDAPPNGPGATNGVEIYGNFLHDNPTEALFQGEGDIGFYANLLVTSGTALRVQTHNGAVRDVRIFHNTVVAGGSGISVSGGAAGFTQRVIANAVFCTGVPVTVGGATASQMDNVVDTRAAAPVYLNDPLAGVPGLDLFPRPGPLRKAAADLSGLSGYPDWDRDFNGTPYDAAFRGAYSGEGSNPGWAPVLGFKP
jgi:hypothetical protein